ncbi:DJ-1/PfpI family protein [Acidovorax sp.]|uniref:GlxA family transcriptional regulator n=1 Tax=Acidovorax sp. TaxID=1872122 RepID=UPI0025BA2D3D|nr:DJ-1/PfpI family protein [Acidovorax sp.]MBL7090552.1 DJ-1/PfpI family protein [Acidovorax sp.]
MSCHAKSAAVPATLTGAGPCRDVVLLAFEGVEAIDIAAPASAFSKAALAVPGTYRVHMASPRGGAVGTNAGFALANTLPMHSVSGPIDTLIVAGGEEDALRRAIYEDGVGRWLAQAAQRSRRVASVCTGAFALAAAGLLEGCQVTTHTNACDLLAQLCPGAQVQRDRIFVRDGALWTSAGVTTGLDMALALIEEDLGRAAAMQIARDLAVFTLRSDTAPQLSPALLAQADASARLRELMAWIQGHLTHDLSVDALAQRAHMSPRNFARTFAEQAHCPPARFVAQVRAQHAAALLRQTDWPQEKIAARSGFGSVDAMVRAMQQHLGIAPGQCRAANRLA